jgi:xanthine dehydrogenase YagS FAD-binding subunit
MRPFTYSRTGDAQAASQAGSGASAFLAGGTTLLDLMKQDVMQPQILIDINGIEDRYGTIEADDKGLKLGAMARMATVADHPAVLRDYPAIAQSLALAASAQLRNMATVGGNVLQRTRCNYFRDPSWASCNKRSPGTGCAALNGVNRKHAILGVSDHCIATYPGDFGQALIAFDASVDIMGRAGPRTIRFADLHTLPGDTPHIETVLTAGDLITGFSVPAGPWTKRSVYVKVRDRQSYEFGLASAAVGLDIQGGAIAEARIALGGVATKPWRASEAEAYLKGKQPTEETAVSAAKIAFKDASPRSGNGFKFDLGQRTLVRALLEAATMKV